MKCAKICVVLLQVVYWIQRDYNITKYNLTDKTAFKVGDIYKFGDNNDHCLDHSFEGFGLCLG